MLATVVLPLVDMRPFWSPEQARKLPMTDVRSPEDGIFLRGFGPRMTRRRGGSLLWANEEFFYGSKGFLRFAQHLMSCGDRGRGIQVRYVQARFFFDGASTGRLEVILQVTKVAGRKKDPSVFSLVNRIAELPVRHRINDGWADGRLANIGASLAEHFDRNTTPQPVDGRAWQVACGRPLILLMPAGATFDEKKSDLYPDGLRTSEYHRVDSMLDAAFLNENPEGGRRSFPGDPLAILVDRALRTYAPRTDADELRRFRSRLESERRAARLFMTRYHVEREALRLVVDAFNGRGQETERLHPQAVRLLEIYLSRRIQHLKKPDWIAALPSKRDSIRAAYARAIEISSDTSVPTLLERVSRLQETLGSSFQRYLSQDLAFVGRQIVSTSKGKVVVKVNDKRKLIVLGAGVTVQGSVVVADSIQSSFNSVRQTIRNPQLARYLEDLHGAVAELTTALDGDEAELAAADLKELVGEAGRESPRLPFVRRAADSLATLAKRAAEVGIPVVDLIDKIRGLIAPG